MLWGIPALRADVPVSEHPFPESEQVSDSSIPGEHTIIILSFITTALITLTGLIIIIESPILYHSNWKDIFKLFNYDQKINSSYSFFNYFFTFCNCIMMYLFAYFNHFGFLFIISRQKDKSQQSCNRVMRNSFIYEAASYFLIGFLGYLGLSKECTSKDFTYITRDDGWGNPKKEDYGLLIGKFLYILALFCIVSVRLELVEEIIKHFSQEERGGSKISSLRIFISNDFKSSKVHLFLFIL